jgi:hypothetical protein
MNSEFMSEYTNGGDFERSALKWDDNRIKIN